LSGKKPCYFASKGIPGIIRQAHRTNTNGEDFGAAQMMIQIDTTGALRISLHVMLGALVCNSGL